jgi:hypothetical protein
MDETSVAKRIFESKLECVINVRGPASRWLKDVDVAVKRPRPVLDYKNNWPPSY